MIFLITVFSKRISRFIKFLFLFSVIITVSACQSIYKTAPFQDSTFTWQENARVDKAQFKHLVIAQPARNRNQRLHVYIEGDGVPYINRFQKAKDPSPNYPMMLDLMVQDKDESFYLGRPCYFTHSNAMMADNNCNFHLWTDARYSDAVVTSMVNVLRQQMKNNYSGITLIGHSGGGALAMLMAARMPEVDQVVTLAGNLDTQAWTRYHHFSALNHSLNPADIQKTSLPKYQIHFVGDKDDNIPPQLAEAFLKRIGQQVTIIPNADHNCCWLKNWPALLTKIEQQRLNP